MLDKVFPLDSSFAALSIFLGIVGEYAIFIDPFEGDEAPLCALGKDGEFFSTEFWELEDIVNCIKEQEHLVNAKKWYELGQQKQVETMYNWSEANRAGYL